MKILQYVLEKVLCVKITSEKNTIQEKKGKRHQRISLKRQHEWRLDI